MELWHVRHGERCDEVARDHPDRQVWRKSAAFRAGRRFDPPLTVDGQTQAKAVGSYLKSLPFQQDTGSDGCGFDRVFTSPLQRAVQTAVCVSQELGGLPIRVLPGLSSCTAASRRVGFTQAALMPDSEIAAAFPGTHVEPRDPKAPTTFRGAIAWLANTSQQRVLCIGHREGMRALAGQRVRTPHCCIAVFPRNDNLRGEYKPEYKLSLLPFEAGVEPCPAHASLSRPRRKETSSKVDSNSKPAESTAAARIELPQLGKGSRVHPNDKTTERCDPRLCNQGEHSSLSAPAPDGCGGSVPGIAGFARNNSEGPKHALASSQHPPEAQERKATVVYPSRLETSAAKGGAYVAPPSCWKTRTLRQMSCVPQAAHAEQAGRVGAERRGSCAYPNSRSEPRDPFTAPPPTHEGVRERVKAQVMENKASVTHVSSVSELAQRRGTRVVVANWTPSLLPDEMLNGPSGVLTFLPPEDLCVVQRASKTLATVATSNSLWQPLFEHLKLQMKADPKCRSREHLLGQVPLPKEQYAKSCFEWLSCEMRDWRASSSKHKARAWMYRIQMVHWRASVQMFNLSVAAELTGGPAAIVDSLGKRTEAWSGGENIIFEPSMQDGIRGFALSSSLKVRVPQALATAADLRSLRVKFSFPDAWLPRVEVIGVAGPLLSRARPLGQSTDQTLVLYSTYAELETKSGVQSPSRGCILVGVLQGREKADGGVGFLTVHVPHDLLLKAAARRTKKRFLGDRWHPRQSPPPYRPIFREDLKLDPQLLDIVLSLRTAGVPLWEIQVEREVSSARRKDLGEEGGCSNGERDLLARINVVHDDAHARRGDMSSTRRMLRDGPGLPYSTSGGLTGVVENVLLLDFVVTDMNDLAAWAFSSPIVFSPSPPGDGVGSADNDGAAAADMTFTEVRGERRVGVVEETGRGRVVIELMMVEVDDTDERQAPPNAKKRCPAGCAWMVRVAYVELSDNIVKRR